MDNYTLKLTNKLIELTRILVNAMAMVETIHPIVKQYQSEILKELNATYKGKPITDGENAYLMDDDLFEKYVDRCDEEALKNGFKVEERGTCPLLVAESIERAAKRAFGEYIIKAMPIFEDSTYDDYIRFSEDEKTGKPKRDKLGRMMFVADEIIELALKIIIPQIGRNQLIIKL